MKDALTPVNGSSGDNLTRIWIDLDNTPHVPFFEPIMEELSRRGCRVLLTARDAFQVCELADQKGMRYTKVGRHHGRNAVVKLAGLYVRALQLLPLVLRGKPTLAVSHGSRAQLILCNLLRIPSVVIADYEYAKFLPLMGPSWEIVPEIIPDSVLYCPKERVLKYPGIKEDVYVPRFRPDPAIQTLLALEADHIVVTARPPASEAHYRNPESDALFTLFMERAFQTPQVKVVLLPRNSKQGELLRSQWAQWFQRGRVIIPDHAVDGLNLLWHSDLVVSGGGTMNREAAALRVPVYTVFRGRIGAIDRHLAEEGRLVLIESGEDVASKIVFARRKKAAQPELASAPALSRIVEHIEHVLAGLAPRDGR